MQRGGAAMLYNGLGFHLSKDRFKSNEQRIHALRDVLKTADAVVVGAWAGLSTAAGMNYSGERFRKYFYDFAERYEIRDMYSGGFFPFPSETQQWAWWSRCIYINRYLDAPSDVYPNLLELLQDKDYFVLTTNVDHQFQCAGIDRRRLFYTQGDYGLFQSVNPDIRKTYDNEEIVVQMMEAQGFRRDDAGVFQPPAKGDLRMEIPEDLIPVCPDDGGKMMMNLRCDNTFVEDKVWHIAAQRYEDFLRRHRNLRILWLELGVGMNTPVIIKFPFWKYTEQNPKSVYASVNLGEAVCAEEIADRSICLDADIAAVLRQLKET